MNKEEKEFHLSLFTHFSAEALAEAVERETRYIRSFRRRSRELRQEKAEYIAEFERDGWPPSIKSIKERLHSGTRAGSIHHQRKQIITHPQAIIKHNRLTMKEKPPHLASLRN